MIGAKDLRCSPARFPAKERGVAVETAASAGRALSLLPRPFLLRQHPMPLLLSTNTIVAFPQNKRPIECRHVLFARLTAKGCPRSTDRNSPLGSNEQAAARAKNGDSLNRSQWT
ncbi:MAG: hypothetical protein M2R45_04131 [Verrucomicrobia subdivision 3 bacterium]|nr:hypothetical protein [Limisphaerales bacterium]MCS1417673.1 hypothetical protein [Limisphaerales bacterium]